MVKKIKLPHKKKSNAKQIKKDQKEVITQLEKNNKLLQEQMQNVLKDL